MSILRIATAAAAAVALAGAAEAQYMPRPAGVAPQQAYAIEVSPGTYVIHRPDAQSYPYVGCGDGCAPAEPERHVRKHRRTHNDAAAIEEPRRKHAHRHKDRIIHTSRIVREKPVVIEHRRVVDDPPRVIERVRVEEGPPQRASAGPRHERIKPGEKRVIRADAEVTILGPDRMTIRLTRKSEGRQPRRE